MFVTVGALLLGLISLSSATSPWKLVPSKRTASLERRALWKRNLAPRDYAALNYALSPYHPPSATVALEAHDEQPILMLEEFDHLLHSVACSNLERHPTGKTILLDFIDDDAFNEASYQWGSRDKLTMITAHAGCNGDDEHGAWSVVNIMEDAAALRLTLVAEYVSLRDVVKSFAVKYDHNGAHAWTGHDVHELGRRSIDEGTLLNFEFNPQIDSRLSLFPPNSSLDDSVISSTLSALTDSNIELACVGCVMKTNVSIGVDFNISTGGSQCFSSSSNQTCFGFNNAAMNLTIVDFEQVAELEFSIGKELAAATSYKVLSVPIGPALVVPGIIDLGPSIGVEIAFALDISAGINFTYGATGHIPSGAFAAINLVNSTGDWDPKVTATGWDGAGVDQIPFRVNSGEFNVTSEIGLVPYAELGFTVFDVGAVLRLIQNVPEVVVDASLHNAPVTRECNAVGADDFESFGLAFSVTSGMSLSAVAQFLLEKGELDALGFPSTWEYAFYRDDIPFFPAPGRNTTSCFVLTDDDGDSDDSDSSDKGSASHSGSSTTAPAASKTTSAVNTKLTGRPAKKGTLLAAASAIPTWDFGKIESYYSAHGSQLPTNVNYGQMVQATTVPANISDAINKVVKKSGAVRMERQAGFTSAVILVLAVVLCAL